MMVTKKMSLLIPWKKEVIKIMKARDIGLLSSKNSNSLLFSAEGHSWFTSFQILNFDSYFE